MQRLAVLAPHVVQYHVPIYRELARRSEIKVHVFYEAPSGLDAYYIEEFGREVSWDIDLTGGYPHTFLANRGTAAWGGFFSRVNPSLWKLLRSRDFDAVLVQGYATFTDILAVVRAKLGGLKVLFRGENVLEGRNASNPLREWIKRSFLRAWLRQCDTVFYSCAANRRYYEHYGAEPSTLTFMPCCVDNEYFQAERKRYQTSRDDVRTKLGIGRADFAVCLCAKLMKLKRPVDLLEAVSRLGREDVVAVFIGDGPERAMLEKKAGELDVRTVFAGFVNQGEIGKWYAAMDAAAVVSDYDASPKAVNEAMNFSLPIIASDVIGLGGDLISNGVNGFLVPVGNIDALSKALEELVVNEKRRREMGHHALSSVGDWNPRRAAAAVVESMANRP